MRLLVPWIIFVSVIICNAQHDGGLGGERAIKDTSADVMVQNILQWLQGIYAQNNRKIRQNVLREYLPPLNTERPRPFAPGLEEGPYPGSGASPPQPSFNIPSSTGKPVVTRPSYGGSSIPTSSGIETNFVSPENTGPSYTYPSPSGPSSFGPSTVGSVSIGPGGGSGFTSPSSTRPGSTNVGPTGSSYPTGPSYTNPPHTGPSYTGTSSIKPGLSGGLPSSKPTISIPSSSTAIPLPGDNDINHPPHVHAIDVQCAKDMMRIQIEFSREYDGIIYSRGHYSDSSCQYVQPNSHKRKFTIQVSLNSCGTRFVNGFDSPEGRSYLENVLVLQNEPGIQEVWDSVQAVRCLWEGNLNKALSVALSVGMLRQDVVTFSGDTANARLDILQGRGPNSPPASGLVRIGEPMTLAVTVTGDADFQVRVRDCRARDTSGDNVAALTDADGCILKPKLFGAFQTTHTDNAVIAYAYFNAFKFPDVMDLILECNVELCKTECHVCTNPDQKIEPGKRRRRALEDELLEPPVTVMGALRVVTPDELPHDLAPLRSNEINAVCVTVPVLMSTALISSMVLVVVSLFATIIWLKYQRVKSKM